MKKSNGPRMPDSTTTPSIAEDGVGRKYTIMFPVSKLRQVKALDWLRIGLLVGGILAVPAGLLPRHDALAVTLRILPLLAFLGSVIVLAELTAGAGVFDVIADRIAIFARGSYALLFLLCVVFAAATTATLNLDTTAVLLTPVMLALAVRVGIASVPLAMTTVWLANTASLLLPVSNLTNLLALNRVGMTPAAFAGRLWAVELASVATTMACLWIFYWRPKRRNADRYVPPTRYSPPSPVLFSIAAAACVGFVVAILFDVSLSIVSPVAAGVVILAYAVRAGARKTPRAAPVRRGEEGLVDLGLRRFLGAVLRILPWRLLVFVTGLFLVVETISLHGLSDVMATLIGHQNGVSGMYRAAATGAGLSNAVNNLPAYVAGEAAVPRQNSDQLLALLIGTNVGPIVTPWASLANLLWYERCRSFQVTVPVRRFVATGAVLAVAALAVDVAVLALTG